MSTDASLAEMAERHNISLNTARRRVESGEWPAGRNGKLVRFTPAQQEHIASLIAHGERHEDDADLMDRALALLDGRAA